MSNKTTTALIVLLFASLMVLWFADAQLAWRRAAPTPGGRLLENLAGLRPDGLRRIEIERGAERIVLERRSGRAWQMVSPADVAADPGLVEDLAFRLRALSRLPQADSLSGRPADYGLDPASAVVRLWGPATDAPLAELELGKTLPDRRYVRVGRRGPIEVVPAEGLELAERPAPRWRDREPFRASPIEVDGVVVAGAGPALRLTRGWDAWRVAEPVRFLAEQARVEELVGGLAALRITDDRQFVADGVRSDAELDRFGLLHPRLTIALQMGRGDRRAEQKLEVGNPVPGQVDRLYARRGDRNEVLALESRVLDRIRDLKPNDLRNPRVADINPNRAVRLRIVQGDRSFDLIRSGRTWVLDSPLSGLADPKAVQEYFKALEGLRTTAYLPDNEASQRLAATREPRFTVRVWEVPDPRRQSLPAPGAAKVSDAAPVDWADPSRPADFAIRFGVRDAGKNVQYAQVEGDASILVLDQGVGTRFDKGPWAFRDRLVLQVASAAIDRIRVEGTRPSVTLQAPVLRIKVGENAPVGWWLTDPIAAPADRDAVAKLLKLLGSLQADGFAAEGSETLSAFGLDRPVLRMTWSIPVDRAPSPLLVPPKADPATGAIRYEEKSLLVGGPVAERPGDRYAMITGESAVFILGPVALATLDAEWHDRTIARFDPRAVRRVHLEYPGTPYAFDLERGDRGWSLGSGSGSAPPEGFPVGSADSAVAAASNLSTIRFAQYAGEAPAAVGLAPPYLRVRFEGDGLASPVAVDFGRPLDSRLVYAMAPTSLPGAVFLVDFAPFLPWLNAPVRPVAELPENVFEPEVDPVTPPASAPGTGQAAGQPR